MAICFRAREEFADNRFQLLFIYIDIIDLHTCNYKSLFELRFYSTYF